MIFRVANIADIPQIQKIRNSVLENKLSDPGLISDHDVELYIKQRGKGWVCETGDEIVGFAIADLQDNHIWALFINPLFEGRGIGKILHDKMMNWYFEKNKKIAWLSTSPGTRAERFYRKAGWKESGMHIHGEIKFEMTKKEWKVISQAFKKSYP